LHQRFETGEKGMRRLIAGLVMLMVLGGCNTMQGLGKDVKAGGEALERASKR